MIGELWVWTCTIKVTILFLILVSNMMMAELESVKALNTTSLSFLIWDFLELTLLLSEHKKEMWLENKSTNLFPGKNSWLNGSNDLKIPFNLLFVSTMSPLIFNFCFAVKFSIDSRWYSLLEEHLTSSIKLMMWLGRREWVWSWILSLSFWRCKYIGIRPVIALISDNGNIWNTSSIHKAALYYIPLRTLSRYDNGALL